MMKNVPPPSPRRITRVFTHSGEDLPVEAGSFNLDPNIKIAAWRQRGSASIIVMYTGEIVGYEYMDSDPTDGPWPSEKVPTPVNPRDL